MDAKLNLRYCLFLFIGMLSLALYSQEIQAPVFDAANREDNVGKDIACPRPGDNNYRVFARLSGLFEQGTVFVLELSDSSGNFDSSVELARDGDLASGSSLNITSSFNFELKKTENGQKVEPSLPEDVAGDNYQIRVRTEGPTEVVSPPSTPFSAYYFDNVNDRIIIVNDQGSESGSRAICGDGETVTLSISETKFERFKWFKDDILIPNESGRTLEVSTVGEYKAAVDLGACNAFNQGSNNAETNKVNVFRFDDSNVIELQDSNGNRASTISICEEDGFELFSSPTAPDYIYEWFKDDVKITNPGPLPSELKLAGPGVAGTYFLQVTTENGNGCTTKSQIVTINSLAPEVSINQPAELLLLPGDEFQFQLQTNVTNPQITWYQGPAADRDVIAGATESTLLINQPGTYWVSVNTPTSSCGAETFSGSVTVFEPDDFEIDIEILEEDYTVCEFSGVTLVTTEVRAVTPSGQNIVIPESKYEFLGLQWIRTNEDVPGANEDEYIAEGFEGSGFYFQSVNINGNRSKSNELDIQLRVPIEPLQASSSFLCEGSPLTLTASNETFSYQWFKDGELIPDQSSNQLEVTEPGIYEASITTPAGCESLTEPLEVTPLQEDSIEVSPGKVVDIGGQSEVTFTASGAENYRWADENGNVLSEGPSITLSELGTYQLISGVGDCEVTDTIILKKEISLVIPNVITANGDGFNDRWVLPEAYVNKDTIEVIILDSQGQVDFSSTNYQNNWPEEISVSAGQDPVYFYLINDSENGEVKKGTITVMR